MSDLRAGMKSSPWFLGIDLGTGSCKSIAVDEEADVLGFGVGAYTGAAAQDRWQEQDPRNLLQAAIGSVRQAVSRAGVDPAGCAGMSIGGALHSLLALDRRGEPLTGVITWADGRAAAQAEAMRGRPIASQLYRQTGCPAHGMYPLYKIIWLREHRPEVFDRTSRYVSAKEYVFARLTGDYAADYSIAAGSGLMNTETLRWDPLCLDTAGIREDQLSPVGPPLAVHRGLDAEMARHLGLRNDVPVVLGSSDAVNSSLGAGAVFPGQATCMVGTSGALRVICPQPVLDRQARSWCYAIDETHWLVGGAIHNGGVALSWLRDCLNQALTRSPASDLLSFEDVLSLAAQCSAGAGGVICLPFFAGERSPNYNLNARAVFFGLSLKHGVTHLCRALVEGIAFRLKNLQEILTEVGVDIRQVTASGGFTQSDFWLQVVTDALNREVVVPHWGETSCRGAAFWAMLAAGKAKNLEALADYVPPGKSCPPNRAHAAIYDRIYPLHIKLYQAVKDNFDDIARLQRELHQNDKERRMTPTMFMSLIRKRRSIRQFQAAPIEKEKVDLLLEAALRSPSSRGVTPWHFVVVTDRGMLERLSRAKLHGSAFLKGAALGIVVCADATKSDVWVEDASIATIVIQLAAESLGLGSCWIQIRERMHDQTQTAQGYIAGLLQVPPGVMVEAMVAIGYPAETKAPRAEAELPYSQAHAGVFGTPFR